MGATTFGQFARPGEKDVTKAYEELREQALHEYGHNSYNGTISTTHGVKVVQTKPVHRSKIPDIEGRLLGVLDDEGTGKDRDIEKWHKAGAIAVAGVDGHSFLCWYFFGWAAE
jgi:hypothetical protein